MFLTLLAAAAFAVPAGWSVGPSSLPPVKADFDGDKREDLARVLVDKKTGGYALFVWRAAAAKPQIVDRGSKADLAALYVEKFNPGTYQTWCGRVGDTPCPRPKIVLKQTGITFGTKEASQAVVWWDGRAFQVDWLSD